MANSQDQGTGKHPHKSSEQPWPHTEAHGGKEGGKKDASHSRNEDRSFDSSRGGSNASGNRSEEQSLKEREYKDSKGQEHHHTRTYEQQHKGR